MQSDQKATLCCAHTIPIMVNCTLNYEPDQLTLPSLGCLGQGFWNYLREKQLCSVDPTLLGHFPVVTVPIGKGAAASDAQGMSSLSPFSASDGKMWSPQSSGKTQTILSVNSLNPSSLKKKPIWFFRTTQRG